MLPKVIIHAMASLDGAAGGYPVDMETYYGVAAAIGCEAVLFGSDTATSAFAHAPRQAETEEDRAPPVGRDPQLPLLVIPDRSGKLRGLLHLYRRLPYGREVVVLVPTDADPSWITWLEERGYPIVRAGSGAVDYRLAFEALGERFGVKTLRSDSGPTLTRILLDAGLASEISLLLAPVIAGRDAPPKLPAFFSASTPRALRLLGSTALPNGVVHLRWSIER